MYNLSKLKRKVLSTLQSWVNHLFLAFITLLLNFVFSFNYSKIDFKFKNYSPDEFDVIKKYHSMKDTALFESYLIEVLNLRDSKIVNGKILMDFSENKVLLSYTDLLEKETLLYLDPEATVAITGNHLKLSFSGLTKNYVPKILLITSGIVTPEKIRLKSNLDKCKLFINSKRVNGNKNLLSKVLIIISAGFVIIAIILFLEKYYNEKRIQKNYKLNDFLSDELLERIGKKYKGKH